MAVLAALATIPTREAFLPLVLRSLRQQVDRLCVYLNGHESVPASVLELADEHVLDSTNVGAERKFWWAEKHDGVYLSCDDDIVYPADYAAAMAAAVDERGGGEIVTAHGRCYVGRPSAVHEVTGPIGFFHKRVDCGRRINHGGTGVMAWDASRIRMPTEWTERNMADLQVAVWAQRAGIPLWLVPHQAHWLQPLALTDPNGIYKTAQAERFQRRNALLAAHGREHGWKLL